MMSDCLAKCGYHASFKMIVINGAQSLNNCEVAKKYAVTESHVRRL